MKKQYRRQKTEEGDSKINDRKWGENAKLV